MEFIPVEELLSKKSSHLQLQLLAGEKGLKNKISNPRIQKPGLALSGFLRQVHQERVQIIGCTELNYLATLSDEECSEKIKAFCRLNISCLVISTGLDPPETLVDFAELNNIPVFQTELPSSVLISRLSAFLEERLAPETYVHGGLVEVYGVGVLILGSSGIGKSECALELIGRGHPLIADDVVRLKLQAGDIIVGSSPDLSRHYIEIRGLGVINIKELFGISAVRKKKQIELVIELKPWSKMGDCERLGLDEQTISMLGVDLPLIVIPVAPGRNLAVIIEVAARNQLLKQRGYNSAAALDERLTNRLQGQGTSSAE